MTTELNIANVDKAAVLVALYNNARVQGMGVLQARDGGMELDEANKLLSADTYFDYVHGRVMKVDLSGDTLRTALYDRDNGQGAAEEALRSAGLLANADGVAGDGGSGG